MKRRSTGSWEILHEAAAGDVRVGGWVSFLDYEKITVATHSTRVETSLINDSEEFCA